MNIHNWSNGIAAKANNIRHTFHYVGRDHNLNTHMAPHPGLPLSCTSLICQQSRCMFLRTWPSSQYEMLYCRGILISHWWLVMWSPHNWFTLSMLSRELPSHKIRGCSNMWTPLCVTWALRSSKQSSMSLLHVGLHHFVMWMWYPDQLRSHPQTKSKSISQI